MSDDTNRNWIDGRIAAAAARAMTETPQQQQARHMRIYRGLCRHEGVAPLKVTKAEDE